MKRFFCVTLCLSALLFQLALVGCQSTDTPQLPRVIVSTDVGGLDEDDYQSMVHLLVYADVLDIEGLVSSPPDKGRTSHLLECIDAYAVDYANLRTHSERYPTPKTLRGVVRQGLIDTQQGEKPAQALSDGAQHIIDRALADDPRPVYVLVWGSMTDVAQALHAEPGIKQKLRVVTIGSWNTKLDRKARDYVYNRHPDLWWIESDTTFRGMYVGGDQQAPYGNKSFPETHIAGHGALGKLFMQKKPDIKMGDTPTVLYLLHGDPDDPQAPRWGGAYLRPDPDNRPTYWHDNPAPDLAEGKYPGARTANRWRLKVLRDWADRMDRAQAPASTR